MAALRSPSPAKTYWICMAGDRKTKNWIEDSIDQGHEFFLFMGNLERQLGASCVDAWEDFIYGVCIVLSPPLAVGVELHYPGWFSFMMCVALCLPSFLPIQKREVNNHPREGLGCVAKGKEFQSRCNPVIIVHIRWSLAWKSCQQILRLKKLRDTANKQSCHYNHA